MAVIVKAVYPTTPAHEGKGMSTETLRSACARTDDEIALIANSMRHDIIAMLEAAGSGHPGGSLSATDVMATLFFSGVLAWDPQDSSSKDRDRFVLSKGHAAPALYALLAWKPSATMTPPLSISQVVGLPY